MFMRLEHQTCPSETSSYLSSNVRQTHDPYAMPQVTPHIPSFLAWIEIGLKFRVCGWRSLENLVVGLASELDTIVTKRPAVWGVKVAAKIM